MIVVFFLSCLFFQLSVDMLFRIDSLKIIVFFTRKLTGKKYICIFDREWKG